MAGPLELGQIEGVDVQQRAGLRPFIAPGRGRALGAPLARHAVAGQQLYRSSSDAGRSATSGASGPSWSSRAHRGSPAPHRRSTPTGTTAAARTASADTTATPARRPWQPATGATTDAPSPAQR